MPGSDKLLEAPGSKLVRSDKSDVLAGSDIQVKGGSGTGDMPAMPKPSGSSGGLDLGPNLSLDERDESDSDSALDEDIGSTAAPAAPAAARGATSPSAPATAASTSPRPTAASPSKRNRSTWAARRSNRWNCPRTTR
jgi:hypothetical protein